MTTLKLSLTGFDNPESTFIKTSIELAAGMDIGQWVIVENEEADVIFVNTDTLSCQTAIAQYAASGHQKEGLFIDCSENCRQSSAATLSLKRPVTYPTLVSLLFELQVELRKPNKVTLPAATTTQPKKRFHAAIPRPLPSPKPSPSIIVNRILKDLPTQEFEIEKESTCISEPTTEVEYLDVEEDSVNISDLFKAAEISVLNDIVRPADTEPEQASSDSSTIVQTSPVTEQPPIHSVEHFHSSHIGLMEGNERDLLLLDRPARRFYEATRFLGILKSAIEKNQATEITHYQFPAVRIYPDQKTYATPQDSKFPIKMFRTLAVEFSNQKLTKLSEREAPVGWQIKPLWQLQFLATLYASEGRLMEGTLLSDKLQLVAEPDYNLVPRKPEYEAIARTMKTYNTSDLKTIADNSGVRIETVIDFCNACEEAQLIKRITSARPDNMATNEHRHYSALYREADNILDEPKDSHSPSLVRRIKSILKKSEK